MIYLVMECHPAYAIVLDREGRMMKVANLGYEEGQTVSHVIARQIPKAPVLFRIAPVAVAACLCLAVLGSGAYGAYRMPYGTVEVRINPDVKMSVSYMDRVVGMEGVNEDGKRLIENMAYKGQTSEDTAGRLVERAIEMGYLSEGGDVYVTADGANARWTQKRAYAIESSLDSIVEGKMPVNIHVSSGNEENPPVVPSRTDPGMPGGTGETKPVFMGGPLDDGDDREDEDGRDADDHRQGPDDDGENEDYNKNNEDKKHGDGREEDKDDKDEEDGDDRDEDDKDEDDEDEDDEDAHAGRDGLTVYKNGGAARNGDGTPGREIEPGEQGSQRIPPGAYTDDAEDHDDDSDDDSRSGGDDDHDRGDEGYDSGEGGYDRGDGGYDSGEGGYDRGDGGSGSGDDDHDSGENEDDSGNEDDRHGEDDDDDEEDG